jgi:hypothetical protein
MEQHSELINGQWIRTQQILYGSDAELAAAGIGMRDTVAMGFYRIPDADRAPSCDKDSSSDRSSTSAALSIWKRAAQQSPPGTVATLPSSVPNS